ncbi:MAG TPA: hypothetical protein VG028_17635 [Terriglobia bacterium]|nr:hypothetical protein [Terriglobia bacterium]
MLKNTLLKVASTLEKLHLFYALIGGLAVIARGGVRATKDVDFPPNFPLQQSPAQAQSLNDNGRPATFRRGGAHDRLSGLSTLQFPPLAVEGIAIPVVTTDYLFPLKLFAGGPQDILGAAQRFKLQSCE